MTCPKDRPANSRLARRRVTDASATGLSVSFWSRGQHPRAVTLLCPAGEANVAGRIPRRPSLANQSTLARARHRCPRHDTRQSNMGSIQSPDGTLVESRPTAAQSVTRSCLTAPWSAGARATAHLVCTDTAPIPAANPAAGSRHGGKLSTSPHSMPLTATGVLGLGCAAARTSFARSGTRN
jgi:hypothetical protein